MSDTTQLAKHRLEELISFFGVNVDATATETEEGIALDVAATPATPRLIGHHGDTLRAIEYIVNQIVKREQADAPRISVDIAGYRAARRAALEQLAQEVAERVTDSGQEEELPPMNPAERRIVHMVLRDLPAVTTESRGQDRGRRIVVLPRSE